ncbi:MAG: hypothetical protein ACRDL5_07930 [Solirubrobacteraceae bacterium]
MCGAPTGAVPEPVDAVSLSIVYLTYRAQPRFEWFDYAKRLLGFGARRRSGDGPCDSSHIVLDILYGRCSIRSLANCFKLTRLTAENLGETVAALPRCHWFDNQPLPEM